MSSIESNHPNTRSQTPKILFIRQSWKSTGGAENYLRRLSLGLKKGHGFKTQLLCKSWDDKDDAFDEVVPLHQKSGSFSQSAFAGMAERYIKKSHFDLVFSMERGIACDIYRAGDGLHAEWLKQRVLAKPWLGRLKNILNPKNSELLRLEKYTLDPAHTRWIIANSEMVHHEILAAKFPASKIRVIENGVDFNHFASGDRKRGRAALGWPEHSAVALLVGHGSERKGHAYAREAVSRASWIDHLEIVDSPPPCSMPDLYASADIFILPTLYDPFANVTLEAMAAGLPVVTTSKNGASRLIRDRESGLIVERGSDVPALVLALDYLGQKEVRKRMSLAAREVAQLNTLDQHIVKTHDLLMECLGNKSFSSAN